MIKLYKSKKRITTEYVYFIEDYFNTNFSDKIIITEKDKFYIREIDKSSYLGNNVIDTPYGKTTLEDLSLGCKTLLVLNHSEQLGNPVIDLRGCDKNALYYVYQIDNAHIYLDFWNEPLSLEKIKDIPITILQTTKDNVRTVGWLYKVNFWE